MEHLDDLYLNLWPDAGLESLTCATFALDTEQVMWGGRECEEGGAMSTADKRDLKKRISSRKVG